MPDFSLFSTDMSTHHDHKISHSKHHVLSKYNIPNLTNQANATEGKKNVRYRNDWCVQTGTTNRLFSEVPFVICPFASVGGSVHHTTPQSFRLKLPLPFISCIPFPGQSTT